MQQKITLSYVAYNLTKFLYLVNDQLAIYKALNWVYSKRAVGAADFDFLRNLREVLNKKVIKTSY